ncbi:hypothetical protein EDD18DRAFT_818728 [Armillaria luteobubalina]|uniref:C2H2-type domain-containing protein n=1 Tax=Armillaria luteobubalina TaxID=153913 RepID=A0AA39QDN7_9AGAR|nr:hypothetical protein EDD18DRAFT_818728 [Armillaria luteobubalina]
MSDPRAHVIYTKLLLRRGHGYPLWIPESDYNLPEVYRNKGVSVGDLGILTDDGGFDFLFNVCAEADDPVNQGHVPPQFQPLRISSSHAIREIPFHCKNTSITSAHVSKTTIAVEGSAEMPPFVTGGGRFEFSTSKAEAAILMLPDGGIRYDTRHRSLFKQYAAENALSWYIYVNSLDHLAREAPNGSLYLVTGCDKARSWMTAAASRPSQSHTISVKFAIGPIMEGRIALHTSWSTPYIDADTRIYPDYPNPMPQRDNQCVFMRGFTITVRENSFIQKVLGPVQLKVIGGSTTDAAPSFHLPGPYSSYQDNTTGSSSSRVLPSTGLVDNLDVPGYSTNEDHKYLLKDDIELVDLPGRSTELLNPSAKINEQLLMLHPHTTVAITHDEDWIEVTKDLPPDEWPDDFKLASMVSDLFEKRSAESYHFPPKPSPSPQHYLDGSTARTSRSIAHDNTSVVPSRSGSHSFQSLPTSTTVASVTEDIRCKIYIEDGEGRHQLDDDDLKDPRDSSDNDGSFPPSSPTSPFTYSVSEEPHRYMGGGQNIPFGRARRSSETSLAAAFTPSFGARDRSASVNGHPRHLYSPASPFVTIEKDSVPYSDFLSPHSQPSLQVYTDRPFGFHTPPSSYSSSGNTPASFVSSPFPSPKEYRPQSSGSYSDQNDLSVVSPSHESSAVENPYQSSPLLHPEIPRGHPLWRLEGDFLTSGSNSRSLSLASMPNLGDLDHDIFNVLRSSSVAPNTRSDSGIDSSDILAHLDLNPSVVTSDIFGDIPEQQTDRLSTTDASLSPTSYGEQVASDTVAQAGPSRRTNAANYTCPECHQTFTAEHNLNSKFSANLVLDHLNSHFGVREFHCAVPNCNLAFGTSHVRHRHMIKCHPVGAEAEKHKPHERLS